MAKDGRRSAAPSTQPGGAARQVILNLIDVRIGEGEVLYAVDHRLATFFEPGCAEMDEQPQR